MEGFGEYLCVWSRINSDGFLGDRSINIRFDKGKLHVHPPSH